MKLEPKFLPRSSLRYLTAMNESYLLLGYSDESKSEIDIYQNGNFYRTWSLLSVSKDTYYSYRNGGWIVNISALIHHFVVVWLTNETLNVGIFAFDDFTQVSLFRTPRCHATYGRLDATVFSTNGSIFCVRAFCCRQDNFLCNRRCSSLQIFSLNHGRHLFRASLKLISKNIDIALTPDHLFVFQAFISKPSTLKAWKLGS